MAFLGPETVQENTCPMDTPSPPHHTHQELGLQTRLVCLYPHSFYWLHDWREIQQVWRVPSILSSGGCARTEREGAAVLCKPEISGLINEPSLGLISEDVSERLQVVCVPAMTQSAWGGDACEPHFHRVSKLALEDGVLMALFAIWLFGKAETVLPSWTPAHIIYTLM